MKIIKNTCRDWMDSSTRLFSRLRSMVAGTNSRVCFLVFILRSVPSLSPFPSPSCSTNLLSCSLLLEMLAAAVAVDPDFRIILSVDNPGTVFIIIVTSFYHSSSSSPSPSLFLSFHLTISLSHQAMPLLLQMIW